MKTLDNHFDLVQPRIRFPSWILFLLAITGGQLSAIAEPPCPNCPKTDWTTLPSRYTHDSEGRRVDQFALPVAPVSNERPDFQRSGYRNYRSSLQAGTSADNLHVVEEWGNPVQPYEQWRFPYRPYSVPYGQWGPQPPAIGVLPYGGFGGLHPFGAQGHHGGFRGQRPPGPVPPVPPGPVPNPNGPPVGFPPGGPFIPPGGFGPMGVNPYAPNGWQSPFVPDPQAPWINGHWEPLQEPSMSDREFFNVPLP